MCQCSLVVLGANVLVVLCHEVAQLQDAAALQFSRQLGQLALGDDLAAPAAAAAVTAVQEAAQEVAWLKVRLNTADSSKRCSCGLLQPVLLDGVPAAVVQLCRPATTC